ncbi:hypothetical protein HJG60_010775 [Phyllostomus discolor]|uniref:Uncharacterized protein n=1 Tax=Phyllostomus discolor TaxID=89673 RepID=A0A834ADU3_9CHIR|nr:hypothetical protein HJG60_010775 [Phyllostomus discolor]
MPPDGWTDGWQLGLLMDDRQSPAAPLWRAKPARSLRVQKAKGSSFWPWENRKTQSTLQQALERSAGGRDSLSVSLWFSSRIHAPETSPTLGWDADFRCDTLPGAQPSSDHIPDTGAMMWAAYLSQAFKKRASRSCYYFPLA